MTSNSKTRIEDIRGCKGDYMLWMKKVRTMVQTCWCRDFAVMEHKEKSLRWCLWGGRERNKWMNVNMSVKKKERKDEQHPIKEKEDNWWRGEKKTEWLYAYRAQMSRGNCAGGLLCRHLPAACLPACSAILFFPAALILRFIWRAQHSPDR